LRWLLPSRFAAYSKNVLSPLRSDETTNAAIPVFGGAETPPAFWRRGVQPEGKTGSVFPSSSPEKGLERVAEGVDPYHCGYPRFRQSRNAARTLTARGTAGRKNGIRFSSALAPMVEALIIAVISPLRHTGHFHVDGMANGGSLTVICKNPLCFERILRRIDTFSPLRHSLSHPKYRQSKQKAFAFCLSYMRKAKAFCKLCFLYCVCKAKASCKTIPVCVSAKAGEKLSMPQDSPAASFVLPPGKAPGRYGLCQSTRYTSANSILPSVASVPLRKRVLLWVKVTSSRV